MKLKALSLAIGSVLGLGVLAAPVSANDDLLETDVRSMFYMHMPFDGGSKQQQATKLGFAVYRHDPTLEQGNGFAYHPARFQSLPLPGVRSAFADIRFNADDSNWDRFNVGGVDALTYETKLNADGTAEQEATGISPAAIVAGVVIGVVVVNEITDDDDRPGDGSD